MILALSLYGQFFWMSVEGVEKIQMVIYHLNNNDASVVERNN